MTPTLKKRLHNPFDEYEVLLLEHIALAQEQAVDWMQKAQSDYESDTQALHSYVEHMAALARSHTYYNALYHYREYKRSLAETTQHDIVLAEEGVAI
jgi:hypothetical protein